MDTLDFLRRVLPSSGYYAVAKIDDRGPKHGFYADIEELATTINKLDKHTGDTYYAVSSYKVKGKRTQANVAYTKLLALDIDVGKPKNSYGTAKEALAAIAKFIKDTKFPKPMIVASGMGFHIYWVMTEDLPPERWKPLADAFKQVALQSDLIIDPAVPADSARVLRPVGATHTATGKKVKVILDADPVSPTRMRHAIEQIVPVGTAMPSSAPTRAVKPTGLLANLAVDNDMPACKAEIAEVKCNQIARAMSHPDEVPEPLWYLLLGVAAYTEDPEETAKRWSEGHPTYNESQTIHKMLQWKNKTTGPSTCEKFAEHNPEGCKKCPYKGRISTPAQLGRQFAEVQNPEDPPDQIAASIQIPKPFKRTSSGIKVTIDDSDIDVCPFDIYPVGYGKDHSLGYETVRYHWKRPHVGWQELSFRQAYLAEGSREFPTAIADQGIVLANKRQTELFQLMLRAYMEELRRQRAVTNLYATMGWKENFTQFVLGDTVLRRNPDGSVSEENVTLSHGIQRQSQELFTTSGSMRQWAGLVGLLARFKLHPQLVALAVGASAPLYAMASLKGITLSLCGETGSGKTLTQIMIQSIFGNPEKLHFSARFTPNVVYTRMGFYSNLPFTIDEGSVIAQKELGDLVYCVPQGRDKARLNRNADEREAKEWALPLIISTNKPMQGMLYNSTMVGDAQMARLIELPVDKHPMFASESEAGRRMYMGFLANHGHAGRAIIKNLLQLGPEAMRNMVELHYKKFSRKYSCKFTGQERFWEQALVLADLMMELMVKWGLLKLDHAPAFQWAVKTLSGIRNELENSRLDTFDIISNFLNDHASSILTIMHTTGSKAQAVQDREHAPRADIRARFDVYRKSVSEPFTRGTLMLDRGRLREWMLECGYDYTTFMRDLKLNGIDVTPASRKFSLGKNTALRLGQTYVVGIGLNHPRLIGMLENIDQQNLSLVLDSPEPESATA